MGILGTSLIGSSLDKYEVLQKVGEGGMATVYKGRHSALGREVAIKVLHPHLSSSDRNRRRFKREAHAIEKLRHEHILEIFDYSGVETDSCYIVTEFVEGATLTEILHAHGTLPSEVVAMIGLALARALAYAHDLGILHRDLKPDNVMLRADGQIKLMDFGIARFLDETHVTMTGTLVGSPGFMSPEQALEGQLDQRADIFALGSVLYQLLTGKLPFSGSNASIILKNVIEGNRVPVIELAPAASAHLANVIEQMMATDPDARPATAHAVAEEFEASLAECDVDPTKPEWSLEQFLGDAPTYRRRLDIHLVDTLIAKGKLALDAGDPLAALQLFNRVLSMDDSNEEVVALVQNLHGVQDQRQSRQRAMAAVALSLVVATLLVLMWLGAGVDRHATTPENPMPATPANGFPQSERVAEIHKTPADAAPETSQPIQAPAVAPAEPPPSSVRSPRRNTPARVTPSETPPAQPNAETAWGGVKLLTGSFIADVYIAGTERGDTRGTIRLPPGEYEAELRAPHLLSKTVRFTVEPDTVAQIPVPLLPRPVTVSFPELLDGNCVIVAHNAEQGTLSELGWRWTENSPHRPLSLGWRCADGTSEIKALRGLPPNAGTFDAL